MERLLSGLIIIVLISGCSTLQTNVRKDVDWPAYSSVEISVSEPDRWELRSLTAERLANWGFVVVDGNLQHAELLAILEITEGSSLAETGEVTTWPKNLLLRLHDRSNGTELARSRYQLAPTQNPKHGLTLMVNDLRKQTNKVTRLTPRPQPSDNKSATSPTQSSPTTATDSDLASPSPPVAPPVHQELSEPGPATSNWTPRFRGWQFHGDNITQEESY